MAIDPKQTRKARGLSDCPVDPASGVWLAPPGKPPVRCSPAEEPVPELFRAPTASEIPEVADASVPDPIPIMSGERIFRCSDFADLGPDGDNVRVAAGAETRYLSWLTVPDISSAQLSYLAHLGEGARGQLWDSAVTIDTLQHVGKLLLNQAVYVRETMTTMQTAVDAVAEELGRLALRCGWLSTPQTAECPEGALTAPYPDGVSYAPANPVTVGVGARRSLVSQQDADLEALQLARSLLSCVYGNTVQQATCPGEEEVPNSPAQTIGGIDIPARVGNVTVPANTWYSHIDQQDADNQARLSALAALRCLYINERLLVDCSVYGKPTAALQNGGSLLAGTVGNPVVAEEGVVISTISTQDANTNATNRARALLNCLFYNEEITVECPDGAYGDQTIPASDKSPVRTVTIAAGEFSSTISVAEANLSARVFAEAQLQCLYCNPRIPPTCIAPSVLAALAAPYGGNQELIPLPIPASMVDARWSTAATLGVAAGAVCGASPQIPVEVGALIGVTKPRTDDCPYESDEIVVSCISGSIGSGTSAQQVHGLFEESQRAILSSKSLPNPSAADESARVIKIAAGFQVMLESRVPDSFRPDITTFRAKAYANYLALQFGLGLLDCFFENDAHELTCAEVKGGTGYASGLIGGSLVLDRYAIAAGVERSYVSKSDADTRARQNAQIFLTCIFANERITLFCPDPTGVAPESAGSTINPVVVDVGAITSEISQEVADDQALAQAKAMLNCYYQSVAMTLLCGAYVASPTTIGAYGDGTMLAEISPGSGVLENTLVDPTSSGSTANPIVLPLGFEQSDNSQAEADMRAFTAGLAYLNCYPPGGSAQGAAQPPNYPTAGAGPGTSNPIGGGTGPPGADGAPGSQTGCTSKCLAYYS